MLEIEEFAGFAVVLRRPFKLTTAKPLLLGMDAYMKKIKTEVNCNEVTGQLTISCKEYDIGAKTLHINGAGTKSIVSNFLNSQIGTNSGIIISVNNKGKFNIPVNNNRNNNTINGTNSLTAGAVDGSLRSPIAASAAPLTVDAAVDACFEELGLIDTHLFLPTVSYSNTHEHADYGFFSWSNKDENDLDYYIQLIYKCAIIQHSNYCKAVQHLCPGDYDELIPDVNDIYKTLNTWISKTNYPKTYIDARIAAFMKTISNDSIANDYRKYNDAHHWAIRKWIDGDEHHQCRLLLNPDDDQQCVRVSCYGGRDCVMNKIVTYDGDYCLKMPYDLREDLQGLYESDARGFKKKFTEMLKDKFCEGIDVNGEAHSISSFFLAFKKRNIKYTGRDYSDAIDQFKNILSLYPDQSEAKEWIINSIKEI